MLLRPRHRNCHFKPDNLMVLEVREEILRAQVNNKWCDAQRLAIGAVNEKTTHSEEKSREAKLHVNFTELGEAKSFIYFSALSAVSGIFITKWRAGRAKGGGDT